MKINLDTCRYKAYRKVFNKYQLVLVQPGLVNLDLPSSTVFPCSQPKKKVRKKEKEKESE